MLPTFVITLREGLEAAIVIGIIAAFLRQQGQTRALRQVWLGVGLAVGLCVAVAVALRVVGQELPQRQSEGLAAIVAIVAVGFVTYMIVWMSRHAQDLRGRLQTETADALARGSVWALVAMAFFAVLREGFETTVFLLAVLEDSTNVAAAGSGAVLGLVVAAALGWGLYRGGVRIDLGRFFTVTSAILVLIAAGLVVGALGAAAEAGWITAGQATAVDLGWLVRPGSVVGALLTGLFGVESEVTVLQALGWAAYAVPMLIFVLAPRGWGSRWRIALAAVAVATAPALLIIGVGASVRSDTREATFVTAKAAQEVRVAVSAAGCEPARLRLQSAPTTFRVHARDGSTVSEFELRQGNRILGEVENLTPGVDGSFSLTLQPGRYSMRCPGGSRASVGELVVSGQRVKAGGDRSVQAGVERYRQYLIAQSEELILRARTLRSALRSGDVAEARRDYAAARVPWERAEPLGELLGGLDPAFDARIGDVPRAKWKGFHPIERALWVQRTTRGTAPIANQLVADARRLARFARTVPLEPAQVGNGANALLNEVSKSKITGEEERYSHLDLVDFQANVDGAAAAFAAIRPALRRRDEALERDIASRFDTVRKALRRYQRGNGFVSYDQVSQDERRKLSQAIDALAEPLSRAPATALTG